jgi:hypothetical protein
MHRNSGAEKALNLGVAIKKDSHFLQMTHGFKCIFPKAFASKPLMETEVAAMCSPNCCRLPKKKTAM